MYHILLDTEEVFGIRAREESVEGGGGLNLLCFFALIP